MYKAMLDAQSEHNDEMANKFHNFILELRWIAKKKIDQVTHYFLEHIDDYMLSAEE